MDTVDNAEESGGSFEKRVPVVPVDVVSEDLSTKNLD